MPNTPTTPELRFDRANHIEPKSIQNFKKNRAKALAEQNQTSPSLLDDDIASWLIRQDIATKRHINAIIRHTMQVQQAII